MHEPMKLICAYPINLDAVHNISGDAINRFADGIAPEEKEKIASFRDLISALLFCMQTGTGVELLIESKDIAKEIEGSFDWQHRLGGNAGIMADVLAALGAEPVLNAPALSPRLAEMLNSRVRIPIAGTLRSPMQALQDQEEMVHFVFQFTKGQAVKTDLGGTVALKDNRLIATFDPLNTVLYSSPDFDDYCLKNIADFDGALISGFHLAPETIEGGILKNKLKQIKTWKDINPRLFIHAEMGSFQNPRIMRRLMQELPVDGVGLNEDELAAVEKVDPGWRGTLDAATRLRDDLGISRIAVHTRDYIISVMKGFIRPEDEVKALTRGADAAAALAASGSISGTPPIESNPVGLKARDEFCSSGAATMGRGAFQDLNGIAISLVPSLLAIKPKFTVGLGDTATAVAFYEEICALKKRLSQDKLNFEGHQGRPRCQ